MMTRSLGPIAICLVLVAGCASERGGEPASETKTAKLRGLYAAQREDAPMKAIAFVDDRRALLFRGACLEAACAIAGTYRHEPEQKELVFTADGGAATTLPFHVAGIHEASGENVTPRTLVEPEPDAVVESGQQLLEPGQATDLVVEGVQLAWVSSDGKWHVQWDPQCNGGAGCYQWYPLA
jgi:hypothetical protein